MFLGLIVVFVQVLYLENLSELNYRYTSYPTSENGTEWNGIKQEVEEQTRKEESGKWEIEVGLKLEEVEQKRF